jgi:Arc/MetJ-type ribon-helix-helix transcriptional regulator
MSASKLGIDLHLRLPGEVADRLDALVSSERHPSRNALILALLSDALSRRNHAVIQSRYRARRERPNRVG